MTFLSFVLLGGFTGVLSGYLGIGGGIILVPVLSGLFLSKGMPLDITMTSAFSTSLLTAVFTTASAALKQLRQNNLILRAILPTAAGSIFGSQIGAWLGSTLKGTLLVIMFALFLLFAAWSLWKGGIKKENTKASVFSFPSLVGLGFAMGILSALFGIGGGIVMVPIFILLFHFSPGKVAGTSSAIAFLTCISGVAGYLIFGADRAQGMDGFLGVIDYQTAVPIIFASILTAPIGAYLNKRFGGLVYQKIFAAFLIIVSIRMILLAV